MLAQKRTSRLGNNFFICPSFEVRAISQNTTRPNCIIVFADLRKRHSLPDEILDWNPPTRSAQKLWRFSPASPR